MRLLVTWFYLLSSHAFYFSFVREDDACWKQRWLRDADVFGLRRTALAEETSQGEGVPHRVQPQGTLDVRHGLNRPPCQGRAKRFQKLLFSAELKPCGYSLSQINYLRWF